MSISAIVPVWNGRDHLARLLDSLAAQTLPATEILAIDNGSTDGAPDLAHSRGARVIPMGRNAGFAAAVNRGISEARGDSLAVLNSDVELAPDYFALLSAANAPFATGKILSPNGNLDATFDLTVRGGTTWRAGCGMPDASPFDVERPIFSAPWTAVLVRANVLARIGPLEECFESYLEDVDFGLRCAGHRIMGVYIPRARAIHIGSASLGRWHADTVRRIARNQVFLTARHSALAPSWQVIVGQALWGGVALRHGRGIAWLRGVLEGLRGFFAVRRRAPEYDPVLLQKLLPTNAKFIRDHNREFYWRLYFLLTREAK
jgi:GT2 family glycosyltransferase